MFRTLHSRCARTCTTSTTSKHLYSQLHYNNNASSRPRLRKLHLNWPRSRNISTSPENSEKEEVKEKDVSPKSLSNDADQPLTTKSEEDDASWIRRMEHEALTEIIPLQIHLLLHLRNQKPMLPDEWPLELYWKLLTHSISGQIPFPRVQQLKDDWDKMMVEYDDIEKALHIRIPGLLTLGSSDQEYENTIVRGIGNSAIAASVEIEKLYVRMQILLDSVNSLYRSTRKDVGMPLDE